MRRKNVRTWTLDLIKPHRLHLTLGFMCAAVAVLIDVSLPLLFGKYLVDGVLLTEANYELLKWISIGGVALFLLKGVLRYGQVYLLSAVGQRVVYRIRSRMYRHVLNMPLERHVQEKSGNLVARMTSDVGLIQNAITSGAVEMMQQIFVLLITIVALFFLNWQLALVSLTMLPISLFAMQSYGKRIRRFTKTLQQGIADLTSTLQESLEGIRIVKSFRMEEERVEKFEAGNESSLHASMKAVQAMATVAPVMELILVLGMMIVVWYGGSSVLSGRMTTGELVSFLAYLGMAAQPVGFLTKSYSLLQQARTAGDRIAHIMAEPVEEEVPANVRPLRGVKGHIVFKNVFFSYEDGHPVLEDISFEAEPGETIALVGKSGAGKSTLVNLIPRFYTPDAGTIYLDGRDISDLDLGFLRRSIGLVPQETLLFGMSVEDNIRAGRSWITREAVIEAAKLANAHEFIEELPDGYDTVVGERGATLSGGQRQRVAIARAVAGDPKILILDEATSALDSESEKLVRDALIRVQEGRTTFVIAHRLSTVVGATQIIVIGEGSIAEVGTHEQLLQSGVLYPKLYETQFATGDALYSGPPVPLPATAAGGHEAP